MYKKTFDNNSGFTLIEIIASIALLALVITLLLPIFPQILQWTSNTENKLTASNLIGQVAYDLEKESIDFSNINECEEKTTGHETQISSSYKINSKDYIGTYQLCEGTEEEMFLGLYRARIKVYEKGGKTPINESFTYLIENEEGVD
ncbi:prepilin-type N-terminal cleavage/methylation domain-containing protein [Oceanobacillus manasiensis]|uniref:prepilin-type N-terminal cleavage/methylation domain-containing protein n=1 Tax=Oceanobacillus manasiensis TaxID=586413 RepID=UPI0005AAA6E7|nr:prepilin-type N-terminal cleavage/methylation domain-containing protein [Oceanobacillus manasiensis]